MNDGTAIATRMMTGTSVQTTSISVLWVVLDGVGLALALKRTITITSSASTKSVIAVISQSRKSWNQTMLSITGVAALLEAHLPGRRLPAAGERRTAAQNSHQNGHRRSRQQRPSA